MTGVISCGLKKKTEHYYYGTGLIAAELKAGSTSSVDTAETSQYYYLKNSHGDVIGLTDNTGTLTETYRYDAFGTLTSIQSLNENGVLAKAETAFGRFLYAGEQYDDVTGLYYLRARQYDTVLGRFTQEDTYLGDGRNLYVYVRNNPLNSGLLSEGTVTRYMPDGRQVTDVTNLPGSDGVDISRRLTTEEMHF